MFDLIAFDADDTLWDNNSLYLAAEEKFKQILAKYATTGSLDEAIQATERRNLAFYGYGVKSFVLSLIETAVEVTDKRVSAADISAILAFAKDMLAAEVVLMDHAETTLRQLSSSYRLILITKGDLSHQEIKIRQSGLRPYFHEIHVVTEKTADAYADVLRKHAVSPDNFLMVGDSMRSDILPVLELGGWAVFVPNPLTWVHEKVAPPAGKHARFHELAHLGLLPELLDQLAQSS